VRSMEIDPTGNWRLYAPVLPDGATPLGTVTVGSETGALVRIDRTGAYCMLVGGALRRIDGRSVAAALGHACRKPTIDGQRINVYLDADSIEGARRLGGGNISAGIREAIRRVARHD